MASSSRHHALAAALPQGAGKPAVRNRSRGRPPIISTERLLEIAREVFLELGIRATTAEVATRAHIAEGTIFHRFKSKEELFRAAMNFDPDAALHLIDSLPARAGIDDLRRTLIGFAEQFVELARVAMPVMMMSWSNPESQLCQERTGERSDRYARVLGGLSSFLGDEMECGRLRRVDPQVMARMLIGSLHHYCMTELFMGGDPQLDHRNYAEQVVDVLLAAPSATLALPQHPGSIGR